MRALLAALSLCVVLCGPSLASDQGNQWDLLVQSQGERWADKGAKRRHSTSLSGVVAPLAAKAREIVAACGSKVISAVRHTRVRGSGRLSLHASGRAVDMAGNPSCIYSHLANWSGGYSIDYHRVIPNHAHISFGGFEDGKRFAHYGSSKRKQRHAKRSVRGRYAVAQ